MLKSALDVEKIKGVDLLLLTHEHADHFEPESVKRIIERTNATVVAPAPCLEKLDINPRLKVEAKTGQEFAARGVKLKVTKAVHPQSLYPVGYVITMGAFSVYHAGDTYSYTGIEANKATVALLPIGGVYTMDDNDAANACKLLKPKYVIPMHYGTFEELEQEAGEFVRFLGEGTKAIVLKPGQAVNIQ